MGGLLSISILRLLSLLLLFASAAAPASARDVTLRWRVPMSVDTRGVAGYYAYIAPADGPGPLEARPIDVGLPARNSLGISFVVLPNIDLTSPILAVEMTAYDDLGRESARSNRVPLPPDGEIVGDPIWSVDLEDQEPGENPPFFVDYGGDFRVAEFSDFNRVIAAPSPDAGGLAAASFLGPGSRGWGPYEIEGRLFTVVGGSLSGVAIRVSAGNLGSAFLLGGDSTGYFSLNQVGKPTLVCESSTSTGERVVRGRWHRIRLRYTNPDGRARLRAKVWRSGELEPSMWQSDCWTDVPPNSDTGVFSLYQASPGVTFFDDIVVRPVTGSFTPIPTP